MSNAPSYQGYRIRPLPKQRRDTGRWTLDIQIWLDLGYELNAVPFIGGDSFETRDAAIAGCIRFGKDIIDGKVPGCSVAAL